MEEDRKVLKIMIIDFDDHTDNPAVFTQEYKGEAEVIVNSPGNITVKFK